MMYAGVRQHLMPTDLFVRRPLLWMKFASDKRVTVTCSPNFGYRHFLRALGDKTLDGVDLSRVRLIFNGAEPISVELAEEFLARLAPYGLRRTAMFPVYGLAEASLAVSFPSPDPVFRYAHGRSAIAGVGATVALVDAAGPRCAQADVRRPPDSVHERQARRRCGRRGATRRRSATS